MHKSARLARSLVVVVVLFGTGVALAAQPATAVPTPVYNAPPGGGPVTQIVEKFGPFTVDPVGGAHANAIGDGLVPRPPGDFGLKSATFDLVDENDQPIGRHVIHLHHFVIANVGAVDPACPDRMSYGFHVQPLIGSGMERTPLEFADPYAMQVKSADVWGATWHLMNMSDQPHTFYVKYTLGVQPGATADNTRFVTPFWADSRTCPAGTTWNVAGNGGPGSVETDTKSWAMPVDGYLVGIGGHLHDGGISITAKHEDGSFLCENLATYAGGMLDKISACPLHDTVTKGEMISVTSKYDNSAPHDDVMGIAVMFLWAGNQGIPPTTTTTAPPVTDPPTTAPAEVLGTSTVAAATPVAAVPAFTG